MTDHSHENSPTPMASPVPNMPASQGTASEQAAWWQSETTKRWLGILIIVGITLASFWLAFNPVWVSRLGHWGYLGAFVISLIASATIVLPAPGLAIIIAMGGGLDPLMLGIVAGIGSAFGELSGYIAGATGRALIPPAQQHRFDAIRDLTRRYGPLFLAVLAALPFPFFDVAGIVAGILRMRVVSFLIAVAAGKSIKYVVLILVGTGSFHILQRWFS